MSWKVLVTRKLPTKLIEYLKSSSKYSVDLVEWHSDTVPATREFLLQHASTLNGMLCLLTDTIDANFLRNVDPKEFKVISSVSVGLDHIDIQMCKTMNIRIGYTPNVLTDSTADLAIALTLATLRRIPEALDAVKTAHWGPWSPFWLCGQSLKNSTVGIVGFGRIGQAIAKRLSGFDVSEILYCGPNRKSTDFEGRCLYVSLERLLREADVIIVSCPANPDTMEMFNRKLFSQMKSNACFINVARGSIVNHDDLYDALLENKIWAAGLDVTYPEPLPSSHRLLSLPNCLVLPHIGSADSATRETMVRLAMDNLLSGLAETTMPAEYKA